MPDYKVTNPPPGWLTDPEDLNYEQEWATDDSEGQVLATEYGLGKAQPLMFHPEVFLMMFEAGGKVYLWNRADEQVVEITSPTDLDGIVAALKKSGITGLEMKICKAPEKNWSE